MTLNINKCVHFFKFRNSYTVLYWLVVSTPLKILVSWDDFSQYMQKLKMFQTTNKVIYIAVRLCIYVSMYLCMYV